MNMNAEKIKAEYQSLRKMGKKDLAELYRQSHRVCDTSEADKETLVMGVLEARFGSRQIEAAFNPAKV